MGIIGCTQGNIELVGFRDIGRVHLWRISFQEFLKPKPQALNRMPQTSNVNPHLGEVIPRPSLRQLGGFCPPTPTIRRTPKIRGTVMGVPMVRIVVCPDLYFGGLPICGPNDEDCSMLGSILGSLSPKPYLWKLPYDQNRVLI